MYAQIHQMIFQCLIGQAQLIPSRLSGTKFKSENIESKPQWMERFEIVYEGRIIIYYELTGQINS